MTTLTRTLLHAANHPRIGLMRYWQLHRQRAHLARLDADALSDVGLTAAEARKEASRPVWDAPSHWKR